MTERGHASEVIKSGARARGGSQRYIQVRSSLALVSRERERERERELPPKSPPQRRESIVSRERESAEVRAVAVR